ncbi:phosphotransferase [Candidatus Uhrbacteria bacterium]|nr:phosphotransferase [Candidatus Uhrbacteria bacterium]
MIDSDSQYFIDLGTILCDLFGFTQVENIELVYDRYRCSNYRISVDDQLFFLKRYSGRSSEEVFETKFAERFFASHAIPIVTSLQDRLGRPAFSYQGEWFSLFPFIQAPQPNPQCLSHAFLSSLGSELAKLHRVGSLVRLESFRRLRLWDVEQFMFELVDLKTLLENEQGHSGVLPIVLETMKGKIEFVQKKNKAPHEFTLPFDCLLHGDPIYQNTFITEEGKVLALFDLEDACVGPRAYEVGRAVMINCFEDGWGDEQFERARIFMESYQHVFPLSKGEFRQGVEMYMIKNAHKLWFEAKHLFDENDETRRCYEAHALRIQHLTEDWDLFCSRIHTVD